MSVSRKFDSKDVAKLEKLGSGSYSCVYKALYKEQTYAMKVSNAKMSNEDAHTEFKLMEKLRKSSKCTNVVTAIAYEAAVDNFKILMTLMEHGSYYTFIQDQSLLISLNQRLIIIEDVIRGLAFIHSCKIIHCDLKPHNVFLNHALRGFIGDFGLSLKSRNKVKKNIRGSLVFLAPELLELLSQIQEKMLLRNQVQPVEKPKRAKNNYQTDIYALAMTMWAIYTRGIPFANLSTLGALKDHIQKGNRPSIPLSCPTIISQLMQRGWSTFPVDRISASEMVSAIDSVNESQRRVP